MRRRLRVSKNAARSEPKENVSGGGPMWIPRAHQSKDNVTQDEIYERRIFDLECHINHLEHVLMMTECELMKSRRKD